MTFIRASCIGAESCGRDVELGTADVTVITHPGEAGGEYQFRCPHCRHLVIKEAEPRTIQLLIAAGCVERTIGPPVIELGEGDTITHDEILGAHKLLANSRSLAAELRRHKLIVKGGPLDKRRTKKTAP